MIKNRARNKRGRLLVVVSCLCFLGSLQIASAQTGTVIMPTREATLKQSMDELQRQTDYTVVVNWGDLDPGQTVIFPAHRMDVTELLKTCLAGSDFGWEVNDGRIAIIHRPAHVDDGRGAHSAMHRNGYDRAKMVFVPDLWSRTQKPFEDMPNIRNTYWNNDGNGTDSISLTVINYRMNSSLVEKDYMDNARTLEIIRRTLTRKEVLASLDYIVVTAASSPEGNTANNEKLAYDRARAMKSYLMWKYPFLDRDMIYTFSLGEDWSGLRKMVEEDASVPNRAEILNIIDSDKSSDAKRAALKRIGNGAAYSYLTKNILPKLRGATACTLHFKPEYATKVVVQERHTRDTVIVEKIVKVEKVIEIEKERGTGVSILQTCELERQPLFAVKTNLLFDVASMLNVEIEVPIGQRWSIAGEYIFPWWLWESEQYAIQSLSANLEGRYWFGKREGKPQLTGWFAGLYAGGGYYDIEWGDKGYQGEFFIAAGLSGGYAHTIGKGNNWRMEYSLGAGYMSTRYREYVPKFGYDDEWHLVRQKSGQYHWIGPTRAKISLVWMLTHGYQKKGGLK